MDHLFAMLQATIANANRGKSTKPYTSEQFMPDWGVVEPQGPMSGEDMLAMVKRLNSKMGGA